MNAPISLATGTVSQPIDLDLLMVELERYRRQSEWLQRINELHARLACVTDLRGMIEGFSVWLMPSVPHDLLAYRSEDGTRFHSICSCHGPERRLIMETAKEVFARVDCVLNATGCRWWSDLFVQQWRMDCVSNRGCLMLIRRDGVFSEEESRIVVDSLVVLEEPLQRSIYYEDLLAQAQRDTLTGLANRRVFEDRIGPLLETARRHGYPITVASMDLDHFKQINDNLGHAAGDEALRLVAGTLAGMVRNSDLLVRMGGDEFILVLPDTDLAAARALMERVCQSVDRLDLNAGDGNHLGISIGLVQWNSGMTRDEWLQRADEVLYRAKKSGRSRVCVDENPVEDPPQQVAA